MLTRRATLFAAAGMAAAPVLVKAGGASAAVETVTPADVADLPRIKHQLVRPPFVMEHEQVASTGPVINEFEMKVKEKEVQIADDAWMQAMTYDGSIPGPMMVVHQGDYVELTLYNDPDNLMQHNIDFHASTGALGGGGLTLINPGEKTVLRFKATRAGVLRLSLRAGRPDDPLACRLGHVRRHPGAAARRAEGRPRPAGQL